MKIEFDPRDLPVPFDPRRRRLLVGLPAGLLVASPLALVACGGGGDDEEDADAGTGVDLHDPGRRFAGTVAPTPTPVTVVVPAGVVIPEGGLAAHTLIGGFGVVTGGSTMLPLAFGGVQLASVYTFEGLPVLLGFLVGGTPGTLDVASTAVALVASALGATVFEGDVLTKWLGEIAASAAVAPLAAVVEAELERDVYALAAYSPAIAAGVETACRTLLAAAGVGPAMKGRRALQGITVDPAGERSGVEPVFGATLNSVYVQNSKLRRAYYTIRRESTTDTAGNVTRDPARTVVASGDVPMLPAFGSAGSIITAVTTVAYAGDDTGLAYSKTPEAVLALPDGAKYANYSVTVLTAGNPALGYDSAWAVQNLTLEEIRKVDLQQMSVDNLALQQVFIDILMPMALTWIGGKLGDASKNLDLYEFRKKEKLALLGELIKLLATTVPAVYLRWRDDPGYGPGGALSDIVQKHLVTLVDVPVAGRTISVPALTPFSIKFLLLLLKHYAYERMDPYTGELLLTFLEGDSAADNGTDVAYQWRSGGKTYRFDSSAITRAGLAVATKALGAVDGWLGHLNTARISGDMLTSKLVETWELKVGKANVRLNPSPFEVNEVGKLFPIKAEIVDNDNDDYGVEKGSWRFDWVCTARHGDLFKPFLGGDAREMNRFSTSNLNATCDYVPRELPKGGVTDETIMVQAWFEPIGSSQPAVLVGTATATVVFKQAFNLRLNPPGPTDVATDIGFGLTCSFVEPLPPGATVAWEWSKGGVGTLSDAPADANPANSHATFDSGASEGTANVTVKATLTLPALYGKPARAFVCDPVTTVLRVRKDLKTMSFGGSWLINTEYATYVCGRCGPGGTNTIETGYQTAAYAVVPKVSGAKSYSVLFEKPTPDVRGGVPFPHTRTMTPPNVGDWLDKGGSYWTGLSGGGGTVNREDGSGPGGMAAWLTGRFSDMKLTITVTL